MRTRSEQIAAIRADQRFWRDLVAEVGADRYAEPGLMGEWTFGDMAGHLAGWRRRTITRLGALARGEADPPPPWPPELDDDDLVNDWIHDHDAGRAPAALVADYDASFDRLIQALEALPDDAMTSVVEWIGEPLIDVDFTGHLHGEHVTSVRAWLDAHPR